MFRPFTILAPPEQQLLAPLLALARGKHGYDRRVWLDELRTDAPTVAARVEALLAAEAGANVVSIDRPAAAREPGREPRDAPRAEPMPRSAVA
jgi:hypothetical protein